MFVDLMSDLRKTLSSYFFRAQFGQPQQRRAPQRMVYSGPTEPQTGVVDEAALAAQRRGGAPPRRPVVDELGMSARAASGASAAVPAGPDPRQLSTNRGETQQQKAPVRGEKEPGRNDPCPCGSGKKYKKCHGRG